MTGQAPFAERELPKPSRPARPVAEVAPEIPEMLCQIIEQMIDPEPAKRPQKAAHVAKALRVFLAAEEQAREVKVEENIVAPSEKPTLAVHEPQIEEDEEEEEAKPPPRRSQRTREAAPQDGAVGKAIALWQEIKPDLRDLLFLAGGALGMLIVLILAEILTGIRLPYLAGLLTGMAISYCVDLFLRWRRQEAEGLGG